MQRRPTPRHLIVCSIAAALFMSAGSQGAIGATQTASGDPDFEITKVDTSKAPYIRIAISKNETSRKLPQMKISENGKVASNVKAYPGKIGQYESHPKPVIMLAIDASNSMSGTKIANAKAAALALLDQARSGDRIGIVTFGESAQVIAEPTEDIDSLRSKIDEISLTQGTAMFDGVKAATKVFPDDATRRIILLLSDGADEGSSATEKDALAAAAAGSIEIFSVGLTGGQSDPATLERVANTTGGDFQSVTTTEELASVYTLLGKQLLRGYWLEYRSGIAGGETVKLIIEADGYDDTVYSYTTPAVRGANGIIKVKPLPEVHSNKRAIPLPDGKIGLILAATPFAFLLGFLGFTFFAKRGRTPLEKRIEPFVKQRPTAVQLLNDRQAATKAAGMKAALAPLFRQTESLLGASKFFKHMHRLLEQANLPIREVELLYMMIAGSVVGGIFQLMMGGVVVKLIIVLTFALLPYIWVRLKARKRKKQFEAQLADVLSTIAASLKAGHSFNQSINAVVKETPDPTAHELQRVMTEARLGLTLEDALDAMAVRMNSVDFEFAVTTVNIQRTVGGSLSEILDMVADTVRNRQQFRKKVKALTSMGSMSAYVLLGMPVFMAGVLSLMSPSYMRPLLHTQTGHYMLYLGAFLMFLGWLACQKIVSIKT